MKRCPECRRDYYDDTLLYCLEDGNLLVQGSVPASQVVSEEPATAILSVPPAVASGLASSTDLSGSPTAILQTATAGGTDPPSGKRSFFANRAAKPIGVIGFAIVVLIGGFFGYRYFTSPSKLIHVQLDPAFDSLRSDPRFQELSKR